MPVYILKRIFGSGVTLIGVSILIFAIARLIPGDPARLALGPAATAEQVQALSERLGLNRPIPLQYVEYIGGLFHGQMGTSLYTNRPVLDDLAAGLPATLELVLASAAIMIFFGLLIGVIAGRWRDQPVDNVARILSLLGVVTPTFVWAILLMLIFSDRLGWLPISGRLSEGVAPPASITGLYLVDSLLRGDLRTFGDALSHIALPAIALSLPGLGQAVRLTRVNVVDSYGRPYAEMARAYGLSERKIALKYVLRPALIPTLTVLGLDIASKLGNAFLVEAVFVWPGVANYGVQTILQKDLNGIIGTVLVISAVFLFVNVLVDIGVVLLDPRIRFKGAA